MSCFHKLIFSNIKYDGFRNGGAVHLSCVNVQHFIMSVIKTDHHLFVLSFYILDLDPRLWHIQECCWSESEKTPKVHWHNNGPTEAKSRVSPKLRRETEATGSPPPEAVMVRHYHGVAWLGPRTGDIDSHLPRAASVAFINFLQTVFIYVNKSLSCLPYTFFLFYPLGWQCGGFVLFFHVIVSLLAKRRWHHRCS